MKSLVLFIATGLVGIADSSYANEKYLLIEKAASTSQKVDEYARSVSNRPLSFGQLADYESPSQKTKIWGLWFTNHQRDGKIAAQNVLILELRNPKVSLDSTKRSPGERYLASIAVRGDHKEVYTLLQTRWHTFAAFVSGKLVGHISRHQSTYSVQRKYLDEMALISTKTPQWISLDAPYAVLGEEQWQLTDLTATLDPSGEKPIFK